MNLAARAIAKISNWIEPIRLGEGADPRLLRYTRFLMLSIVFLYPALRLVEPPIRVGSVF